MFEECEVAHGGGHGVGLEGGANKSNADALKNS